MTPQAEGSYFGPKHLEQTISGYLHIIETGQANTPIEAEYIAQAHAVKEGLWLHTFVSELCGEIEHQITVNSDKQGVIVLSTGNKFHFWINHIVGNGMGKPTGIWCSTYITHGRIYP